jgi:hypothetical protein
VSNRHRSCHWRGTFNKRSGQSQPAEYDELAGVGARHAAKQKAVSRCVLPGGDLAKRLKARITASFIVPGSVSSTDGAVWKILSEGVMWKGLPISLYGQTMPDAILNELLAFDPVGRGGGTFYAQLGDTRYSLAALGAASFPGVEQWLERHCITFSAVTAVGDKSVQLRVCLPDEAIRYINLNWDFLGTLTAEQPLQFLEQNLFADRLAEGDDVNMPAPNYPVG